MSFVSMFREASRDEDSTVSWLGQKIKRKEVL